MPCRALVFVAFLALCRTDGFAASTALVRGASIVSARTLQGPVPVRLTAVSPARDVTAVILSDTLTAEDLIRVRHEFTIVCTPAFLASHPFRMINAAGSGGDVSTLLATVDQLQAALKRITPGAGHGPAPLDLIAALSGVPASLPTGWAHVVIAGRLPTPAADELWISAFAGEAYGRQRARVSFWSLEGNAPGWAQNLSGATMGVVATSGLNTLLPVLNDNAAYFEASWETQIPSGAWPYAAELQNAAGERIASILTFTRAPDFTPPPLSAYLSARAAMQAGPQNDEAAARRVLDLNPADADALGRAAKISADQGKLHESVELWRRLSAVTPGDAAVWAQLGAAYYTAGDFDSAEQALKRGADFGVKNRVTLETQARLHARRNDCEGALTLLEEALALNKDSNDQPLLLLRAECAHSLKRGPLEVDSLERAAALGPIPVERTTALIKGYLEAGQTERAMGRLREATGHLPRDAAVRTQYAVFWEQLHDAAEAETLWKSAIEADGKFEPAYIGLAQHYLDAHRGAEAIGAADEGLALVPDSLPLIAVKESALEALGDIYGARRFLMQHAAAAKTVAILKQRSRLEDWYGSAGAESYADLLSASVTADAPQVEVVQICRRGLVVALRDEKPAAAKIFAEKLAAAGDRSGLDLLQARKATAAERTEIPGGVEALHFLIFGGGKPKAERILSDYSRALIAASPTAGTNGKAEWQSIGQKVHEYFLRLGALIALGERKQGRVEIRLSVADKKGRQNTEKVFGLLGLKLKTGKEGLTVHSVEGRSEAKKQDTVAALGIDDQGIQDALAAGKTYQLDIAMDSVPVFPAAEIWQKAFYSRGGYPGGLVEAFVTDPHLPQLYLALNSMDRAAAQALVEAVPLKTLAERYGASLGLYSAALAMSGKRAEVPGGDSADPVWQALSGASPANCVNFFESLLDKDEGRLMAFFYTLSQLDSQHQKFFTRSPERARRYYDLFRESLEMRRGGERRLGESSFVEFLREVPLNDDGSVDFPGAPEVWMVVKGPGASGSAVAKMTLKMKRSAAPDDEDQILIRLAKTGYKSQGGEQSELANFIAVTRIDAQREQPLSADSALLLAQAYTAYRGLYSYFTALGDLEAGDYQKALSLDAKFNGADAVITNLRLGEVHAVLAMLCLLRESGSVPERSVLQIYRKSLDRFSAAADAASFAAATLSAADDMARLAGPGVVSRDSGIRTLLLGDSAGERRYLAYEHVLEMQKVPSLDALFLIWTALKKINETPRSLDEVQHQLTALAVLPAPKEWRLQGDRKKCLEGFDTAGPQNTVLKLREKLARKKRNSADIEKLSAQLMAELEPWIELALVGRVYARFLDPSDLLVSEDAMLLRKHEFYSLAPKTARTDYFTPANLLLSSAGAGSYFVGGLAEFSLAVGRARTAGNHIGGGSGQSFAAAAIASVRATDWRSVTPAALQSFGATVRLAREWIVESASSIAMRRELEIESRGILSLTRRKALLEAVDGHDWQAVWEGVSVSDLHFLGDEIIEHAPKDLWNSPALNAMKAAATHNREPDALGAVAPDLSGCAQPRLRRYEPYEEYQRHIFPDRLAQRLAEVKLNLAWLADNGAWERGVLANLISPVTDDLISKLQMRDMWDWGAVLEAYRRLTPESLEPLLHRP